MLPTLISLISKPARSSLQAQESRRALLAGLLLLGAITAVVLVIFKQGSAVSRAQDRQDELVLPIVEYNTPEPLNPEDKAIRLKKNKRYDHQSGETIKEAPYPIEHIWSGDWARLVPAIPVSQSDAILIGAVLNSQAYLSSDKTGVYSEFEIRVDQILKGVGILNHPLISAERLGGAVRFPSGTIQKYRTSGQGMARQGRRYVFFLRRIEDGDFFLLTAYELRGEKIVPLDGSTQQVNEPLIFDSYKGADVTSFLTTISDAITEASAISPK